MRGHIKKVYFKDGDIVQVGQPLFDLDPAPFQAEMKQAEAQARAYERAEDSRGKRRGAVHGIVADGRVLRQQQSDKTQADADSTTRSIAAKKAEVATLSTRLELREDHCRPGRQDRQGRLTEATSSTPAEAIRC